MTTRRTYVAASLTTAALVLSVWFAALALITLIVEPATVVVLAPSQSAMRAVATSGAAVLDGGNGYLVARSDQPGFVHKLYANGAWLVWPAMGGGCIAIPEPTDHRSSLARS